MEQPNATDTPTSPFLQAERTLAKDRPTVKKIKASKPAPAAPGSISTTWFVRWMRLVGLGSRQSAFAEAMADKARNDRRDRLA